MCSSSAAIVSQQNHCDLSPSGAADARSSIVVIGFMIPYWLVHDHAFSFDTDDILDENTDEGCRTVVAAIFRFSTGGDGKARSQSKPACF